jgi:hypothetical protein
MKLNMRGKDQEMTESTVDSKVVASKVFNHTDSITSGPITATLYSDWRVVLQRKDNYQISYDFTLLVSEEDQLMFFNALATPETYDRFKYDRHVEISDSDVDFTHFLIENKLPVSLAVRLAVVGRKMENGQELFEAYKNLKQAFFYNRKTGQSSFEIYMLMADQFGIPFADSIFKLKSHSLDMLEAAYNDLKVVRLHGDAKGQIALTTPESFETFLVLKRLMRTDKKQDAMVLVRLAADDGTINWTTVTQLHHRMKHQMSIADLVSPEEATISDQMVYESSRNYLVRELYDRPSADAVVTIFAVLIAKYGVTPIIQALAKISEDPLTAGTLAAFIVVTDFIGQTGDTDTNLQWILLLSGDMDEDNFS